MKFSVLLPTRNRLDLLSYAIETVRKQDYENWEIIVSDNYSDENVGDYVSALNDPRVKYFRTNDFIPVTDNWNYALSKSDGDYVVMLGDDDGLLSGYFSTMKKMIEQFNHPDVVYNDAFLFAYPGVLPEAPEGFVKSYRNRRLFKGFNRPYLLESKERERLLDSSLNFRMEYDYNMQFFLVSSTLIKALSKYGSFYQSPYPDYYASNVLLLKATSILVTPVEMVAIGISPKSFGYYYFNGAEESGSKFLKNIPDSNLISKLKSVILPGTEMNTNWLLSLETLVTNFGQSDELKVNYRRYRHIQICAVLIALLSKQENVAERKKHLLNKLKLGEVLKYGLLFVFIPFFIPKRFSLSMQSRLMGMAGSHPSVFMPDIIGKFKNMLDVFKMSEAHGLEPSNQREGKVH